MSLLNTINFIIKHPLNKNNKFNSIVKFLKWQFIHRVINSKFIFDWVDNTKFILQKNETGMSGNLYCGLMEYEEMIFIIHLLNEDDKFYDIGANVGSYTLLASGVKKCKTVCFEPLPSTFEKLIDNINLNRIQHLVNAKNFGVGNKNEVLSFTNNLNTTNKVILDRNDKDTTEVNVITLDKNFTPSEKTVVKIDVEGYEYFILEGGTNFFSNVNIIAIIIELNSSGKRYGINDIDIHKTILKFGFKPIRYNPNNRTPFFVQDYNKAGNTIYIRDIDVIKRRCLNSKHICIKTANNLII